MELLLENWEVIGILLVSALTAVGFIGKYISRQKFIALWNLVDEAIIIIMNKNKKLNTENVIKVIDAIKDKDNAKKKAFAYLDKSKEKNEKVVEHIVEARKFLGVIGEVGNLAKTGYNLFKGFKKIF